MGEKKFFNISVELIEPHLFHLSEFCCDKFQQNDFENGQFYMQFNILNKNDKKIFFPTKRKCQRAFNDENKNNCKGKMFWLTR